MIAIGREGAGGGNDDDETVDRDDGPWPSCFEGAALPCISTANESSAAVNKHGSKNMVFGPQASRSLCLKSSTAGSSLSAAVQSTAFDSVAVVISSSSRAHLFRFVAFMTNDRGLPSPSVARWLNFVPLRGRFQGCRAIRMAPLCHGQYLVEPPSAETASSESTLRQVRHAIEVTRPIDGGPPRCKYSTVPVAVNTGVKFSLCRESQNHRPRRHGDGGGGGLEEGFTMRPRDHGRWTGRAETCRTRASELADGF